MRVSIDNANVPDKKHDETFWRRRVWCSMKTDRRTFVGGSGLALAGVAGVVTGLSSQARAQQTSTSASFASFGWELANLNNNGADVFFEVTSNLVLSAA